MSKYQSFAITFRPRNGVTDKHITKFMKYVRRTCTYYHVVTEKSNEERHLHAGLFLTAAKLKANVITDLKRLDPTLDDEEKRNINRGVRIQYNLDFIQNYLDKDDDTVVIGSNLPEKGRLESYWPPMEEQRLAMAQKATDKYYANLEALWYQHTPPNQPVTKENCVMFLGDMMFNERKIRVMRDDKHIKNVAVMLTRYLTKETRLTVEWAPWE